MSLASSLRCPCMMESQCECKQTQNPFARYQHTICLHPPTDPLRVVYFSFFLVTPLTFAVPRIFLSLFLRCLPALSCQHQNPLYRMRPRWMQRTLLSAWSLGLRGNPNPNKSVLRLELLQCLGGIIDERKTGSLSTTKLGSKTEHVDLVLV